MANKTVQNNETKQQLIDARFELFGIGVHLRLPEDAYPQFKSKLVQFLPEGQLIHWKKGSTDIDINVTYGSESLEVNGYSVRFSAPATSDQLAMNAVLMTSRLIEKKLNEIGTFSMHGSAVSYGDECVLIIGPSGAGKTTAAVYTCMLDKELAYAAGNRIFLDSKKGTVIEGVRKSSLRLSSILNEFNEFQTLLIRESIKNSNPDTNSMVQTNRISVSPDQLGIRESSYPLKVKAIIIFRKIDSDLHVFEKKQNGDAELLALYTALSEYSSHIPVILTGTLIPYPDNFSDILKRKRAYFSNQLLTSTPVIYIEGRLPEVARHIAQYLKSGVQTNHNSLKLLRNDKA